VEKSGAFNVPRADDLVGDDDELRQECFTQLHSPEQEPSKPARLQPAQMCRLSPYLAHA
jgi:hypothetical protein